MNKPKLSDLKMIFSGLEKYFEDDSVVMQFIPIMLVLVYASYKPWFIESSQSILGKVIAVMLILYYTSIDYVYGTLCCVVIIAFYQMNEREGFGPDFGSKAVGDKAEPREGGVKPMGDAKPMVMKPMVMKPMVMEPMGDLKPDTIDAFTSARDAFIQEKCRNGVLMHKDFPVKSEMADHVYPEIQFNTKSRCNPCDTTCDYSIVEAKIDTETEMCPRSSNNLFDQVKDIFYPKRCNWKDPEPARSPVPNK
jgi:hypothetical protein